MTILYWLIALVAPYLAIHGSIAAARRWPRLDHVLRPLLRPLQLASIVLAVHLAAPVLSDDPQTAILIAERSRLLLFAASLWLAARTTVALVFDVYSEIVRGVVLPRVYRGVLSFGLYTAAAFAVLRVGLGYELGDVLLAFAVVGVVLGLTLQSLLRRLLTGLAITLRGAFGVGDVVRIGEHEGLVETIDWHATTLRTRAGDAVTVPNELLSSSAVLVLDRPVVSVRIPVSPAAPPTRVCELLEECARMVDGVLDDPPPSVEHAGWGHGEALYEVTVWVDRYFRIAHVEAGLRSLASYRLGRNGIGVGGAAPATAANGDGSIARWLAGVPLFAALGAKDLERLDGLLRTAAYGKGEVLFRQGDEGDSIYVVRTGAVAIRLPRAGSDAPISTIRAGGFFGERSLLTGEQRSATAVVVEDSELILVDKASLHQVLLADPTIVERLSEIMIERDEENRALSAAAKEAERRSLGDRILAFFGIE